MENADDTGNVKFVGHWEFVAKEVPSIPTGPSKPAEVNPDTGVTSPQTGDNSHLVLWIALFTVSVIGIAGTAVYSRRKRVR